MASIQSKLALGALLVAVAATVSTPAHGQDGPTLIRQGIRAFEDDFDTPRAITLLRRGVNPAAGPQDSLWAAGVQLLAQFLFDEGDDAESSLWARWAIRIAPDMEIDRVNLVSEVIQSFETARTQAAPGAGDALTGTTWDWPSGDLIGATGRVQVRSNTVQTGLQVLAVGRGVVPAAQGMSLPAGTYEFRATASGFGEATVTREILPGVSTNLAFNLRSVTIATIDPAILPTAIEAAAFAQLARLTVTRFGTSSTCATATLVGANGLVLTTYNAIRGGDNISARLPNGRTISSGITVAAYDVDDNFAVIRLPVTQADSMALGTAVSTGDYTFALAYPGCGNAAQTTVAQVASGGNDIALQDSLAAGVQGGPIIDQSGAIVGLTVAGSDAIGIGQASGILATARRNVASNSMLSAGEVARDENHIFGTAQLSSTVAGATVTIIPLEDHQWPELQTTSTLPVTFAGPLGDYSAEVRSQGQVLSTDRFTINPGSDIRAPLGVAVVASGATASTPGGGGGGVPIPLILVGVAGVAAGAFLLLGGSSDPNGGGGGGGGSTTPGGIRISLPNP